MVAETAQRGRRRKGLAIISLGLGIRGLVSLGLLLVGTRVMLLDEVSWSRSVGGTVAGILARWNTDRRPVEHGGGMTMAGIVMNSVALIIVIVGSIVTVRVFWYRSWWSDPLTTVGTPPAHYVS